VIVVGAAVLGLVVGSFLNVCIARLPDDRSIVRPASACLSCGATIGWRDNIPILSFALLGGRCRSCGKAIGWRYPIIEAVTAALFAAAALRFGFGRDLLIALPLLAALVVVTAIDLEHQIIPHAVTVPGMVYGIALNVATRRLAWSDPLVGILAGGGPFLAIILATMAMGRLFRRFAYLREGGMGGGDMMLGAMLGAFLGWKLALLSLMIGVFTGGLLAVALVATRTLERRDAIPFGPFIALGGAVGLFWGEGLLTWYLGTLQG
jgi:leader peptidase (prepilin peptidase)/N-methyltransferase